MIRVLMSEFEPIIGRGLRNVLEEGGCELVTNPRALSPAVVGDVKPDAVVVDMDHANVTAAIQSLAKAFPGIAIVECSSSDARMRVFPAYRSGKSFDLPLSAETLIRAVTGP